MCGCIALSAVDPWLLFGAFPVFCFIRRATPCLLEPKTSIMKTTKTIPQDNTVMATSTLANKTILSAKSALLPGFHDKSKTVMPACPAIQASFAAAAHLYTCHTLQQCDAIHGITTHGALVVTCMPPAALAFAQASVRSSQGSPRSPTVSFLQALLHPCVSTQQAVKQ
jgi:hypothetical protein